MATPHTSKDDLHANGLDEYSPPQPLSCSICLDLLQSLTATKPQNPHAVDREEPAVRIRFCGHIFGKDCLETWFATSGSNRCPECNQELFPLETRRISIPLRQPSIEEVMSFADYVENILEDEEVAQMARREPESEAIATAIRELFVAMMREQGYEVEYVGAGEDEEEVDE